MLVMMLANVAERMEVNGKHSGPRVKDEELHEE